MELNQKLALWETTDWTAPRVRDALDQLKNASEEAFQETRDHEESLKTIDLRQREVDKTLAVVQEKLGHQAQLRTELKTQVDQHAQLIQTQQNRLAEEGAKMHQQMQEARAQWEAALQAQPSSTGNQGVMPAMYEGLLARIQALEEGPNVVPAGDGTVMARVRVLEESQKAAPTLDKKYCPACEH